MLMITAQEAREIVKRKKELERKEWLPKVPQLDSILKRITREANLGNHIVYYRIKHGHTIRVQEITNKLKDAGFEVFLNKIYREKDECLTIFW